MGRIALLGSTDTTLSIAEAVLRAGHEIACIVHVAPAFSISYSDKPVSVSRQADIRGWCASRGIAAVEYGGVDALTDYFKACVADLCIVAGWYHMVPRRLRDCFAQGAVGLHASRLPELRGGAPLNWAMLAGWKETAVSLFVLSDGVDDGPLYGQEIIPIGPEDYIGDLIQRCNTASVHLIERCVDGMVNGTLAPRAQTGTPSYGAQRAPEDGVIDWRRPAADIVRLVRAVSHPYPGAFSWFADRQVRIWRARAYTEAVLFGAPGQVLCLPQDRVIVATGDGSVEILEADTADGECFMPVLRRGSHRRFHDQAQQNKV
ncbi:methionyl-tRNA formyltransferase [Bordetella hinzii]|uniref:methionyl-tRNA formyltransferase n=1 Tax=Bordetella hinzii TaxID=103855 RepID=UPI001152829C|nr:methionyl-tRNA formyltransferase [Bordetella hinzii]QDJ50215.1 formyl transferase [Bordetella hinzii]